MKSFLLAHTLRNIGARELKFLENVHPTTCVTCHMSYFIYFYEKWLS